MLVHFSFLFHFPKINISCKFFVVDAVAWHGISWYNGMHIDEENVDAAMAVHVSHIESMWL